MGKTTKIWLNYLAGGTISFLLLWNIYGQVMKQMGKMATAPWQQAIHGGYLWLCIGLMFANTSLEGCKWYLLSRSVQPTGYPRAFASYLAGIAFSIITPNRIGEYPGRILYLGRGHTPRYVNVSVLGIMSQLSAVYIFGFVGLVYYNIVFPGFVPKVALAACGVANVFIAVVYWRFEAWLPALGRARWLRRFVVYARLLKGITPGRLAVVLGISLLRFIIFAAQFLFLLKGMDVGMPFLEGFCMVALFFWVMAVIPSITLTELGIRGTVGLYLFKHFSVNTAGIIAATVGIWALNLIIPSVVGSILIIRMRLLR